MATNFDPSFAFDYQSRIAWMESRKRADPTRFPLRDHPDKNGQYAVYDLAVQHADEGAKPYQARKATKNALEAFQEHIQDGSGWSQLPARHGLVLFATLPLFDEYVIPHIKGAIAKTIQESRGKARDVQPESAETATADVPQPAGSADCAVTSQNQVVETERALPAFDETRGCDLTYRLEWCRQRVHASGGKINLRHHRENPALFSGVELSYLHGNYTTIKQARDSMNQILTTIKYSGRGPFGTPDTDEPHGGEVAGANSSDYAWVRANGGHSLYCTLTYFDEHILQHIRGGIAPIIRRCKAAAGTLVEVGSSSAIELTLRNAANIQALAETSPALSDNVLEHQRQVEETLAPVVGVEPPLRAITGGTPNSTTLYVEPSVDPRKALVEGGHVTEDEIKALHGLYFWRQPGTLDVKFGVHRAGNGNRRDAAYRTENPGLERHCSMYHEDFATIYAAEQELCRHVRERSIKAYKRSREWIPFEAASEFVQRARELVQPRFIVMSSYTPRTVSDGLTQEQFDNVQRELEAQRLRLEVDGLRLEVDDRESAMALKRRQQVAKTKAIECLWQRLSETGDPAILDTIARAEAV